MWRVCNTLSVFLALDKSQVMPHKELKRPCSAFLLLGPSFNNWKINKLLSARLAKRKRSASLRFWASARKDLDSHEY